jgi:MotA/TolQ/ExbB proton channel family
MRIFHKGQNKSQVRGELIQQSSVLILITSIAIWQNHFVIQAATADIYIFALLFGAGFFGIYSTVRGTYSLGNDFIALNAVMEVHEDIQRKALSPKDHDIILQDRLKRPPIPYDSPKSIGTAHNLILEEMWRTGSLRISPQTMQVLVHDLEAKLDARKEMAHYLGALMVLLGLLGTFIGLMHTLESVGGILGSLDLSGNAGSGAIASLIESLKRPLEGMATGFGASLFGLIGSLMIGILSKFDSNASNRLLHEFETWIRSVVQIEGSMNKAEEAGSSASEFELSAKNWRVMFQVARSTVLATSKMAQQIEQLSRSVDMLKEHTTASDHVMKDGLTQLSIEMQRLAAAQSTTGSSIDHLSASLLDVRTRFASEMLQLNQSLQSSIRHVADEQAMSGKALDLLKSGLDERHGLVRDQISDLARHVESAATHMTGEASQVRNDLSLLQAAAIRTLESSTNTADLLRMVENRLATMRSDTGHPDSRIVSRREAEELVANLDHLISASRLNPADIARLRHLSSVLEDLASGEPREPRMDAFLDSVKGVAK